MQLLPLIGIAPGTSEQDGSFCICSDSPKTVDGTGVTLDATFAALDAATTTVTVVIPGFEPMENVRAIEAVA